MFVVFVLTGRTTIKLCSKCVFMCIKIRHFICNIYFGMTLHYKHAAVCGIIINVISLLLFVVESEAQGGCSAVPCGPEHRGGDVQQ